MAESQRPDPELFATISYYLGFASSGIILLSLILGFLRLPGVFIIWLALITSSVGMFAAWAARQDFAKSGGSEEAIGRAEMGWRYNRISLIGMLAFLVIVLLIRVAITLLPSISV